jgi:type III secretion protein O
MSIFRDLLAIKKFRESKAELAVRRQRSVLAEAIERRDGAEEQLQQYRAFASEREQSLFRDLCTRIVRLKDIEGVQLSVVLMRTQEQEHEQQRDREDATRVKEASELDLRKDEHTLASRMKEKFVELAQNFADEQFRELERKEDAEMEEVAETRRDRADWDEREEEEEAA